MAHIVEEGFRQRSQQEVVAFICLLCAHHMTALDAYGGCMNCGAVGHVQPVKSRARLHAETEAQKAQQQYKQADFSPGFNAQDAKSQMGRPLTPDQLLVLLRKFNSSVVMKEAYNAYLGRKLMALYVRKPDSSDDIYRSEFEVKQNLQFVCACEPTVMPEWDIIPLDADKRPQSPIRGWRSVVATFYRQGLMPLLPDDGRRQSWYQVSTVKPKDK